MNLRLSNHLNMVGACLTVAQSSDYQPVWTGKDPADFGTDLAQLATDYGTATAKAAEIEGATGGTADAKASTETALEDATYVLARALVSHFRKTGDFDRRGKADLTRSAIMQLRNQELAAKATEIRDLAAAAQSEAGAAGRGVTAARVAALTAAIAGFAKLINAPRGQIVNRSVLLKELETDVAGLLEQLRGLDDLVLQFDEAAGGPRFIDAWKRARAVVDVGGGHNGGAEAPAAPAAPTQ